MNFQATIKKGTGKLTIHNKEAFNRNVEGLGRTDRDVSVTLKLELTKKYHSRPQEKFRWGPMYDLVLVGYRDAGWDHIRTKDDVHREVCAMFLRTDVVNEKTGEIGTRIKSTTELSTIEEDEFQEAIRKWAAEYLGVEIQFPGEQLTIDE